MTNYEPTPFPYGSLLIIIVTIVGIYLFFKYFKRFCKYLSEKNGGEVPPAKIALNIYIAAVTLLIGVVVVSMVSDGGLADWYKTRLLIYQVIVILYFGFGFPIAVKFIIDLQRTKGAPIAGGIIVFVLASMFGNILLTAFLGI